MDANVLTGPWPNSTKQRAHFGFRKLESVAGGLEGALDVATGRDRVAEAAQAAAAAHKDLQRAACAKVECLASLANQLAAEFHTAKNGRAATKLVAIAEQLETLAAECEPQT